MAEPNSPAAFSRLASKCRSLEAILHEAFASIASLRETLHLCETSDGSGDGACFKCMHSHSQEKAALRELKKLSELQHRLRWQSGGSPSIKNGAAAAAMAASDGWSMEAEGTTSAPPQMGKAWEAMAKLKLQLQKRDREAQNLNATVERLVEKKDKLERRVKRLEERLKECSGHGSRRDDWFSEDDLATAPCTVGNGANERDRVAWNEPGTGKGLQKAGFASRRSGNGAADGLGRHGSVESPAEICSKGGKLGKEKSDKQTRRSAVADPPDGRQEQSELQKLFDASIVEVTDTVLAFSKVLNALMKRASWDIEEGGVDWVMESHKTLAVQSYVCMQMFRGFENEDFYMSGRLSCLLTPSKHREECRQQFRAMAQMVEEPLDLLAGMAPDSAFGQFCCKKFLQIISFPMEEALLGDLRHRQCLTQEGVQPCWSRFYRAFVRMAKAIWTLHKLAFSLEQRISIFRAERGADFAAASMVSHIANLEMASDTYNLLPKVAFTIMPGFCIGENMLLKCRVYLNGMKMSSPNKSGMIKR